MDPLLSWGRYPRVPQIAHACRWRGQALDSLQDIVHFHGSTLPFGNGRSYGDSCLASSNQVLDLRLLDRIIHVDWQHGRVVAEAGTTLGEILSISIPNGWFLSVTPGTQFATIGGAIANDVHGKNHHLRGTFGNHLLRFGLQRHDQPMLCCSRTENADYFAATIGGLGLTGVVTWAEIQLMPIQASGIDSTATRFGNLAEFFTLSAEHDHKHEYSVAWVDCLATARQAGRGVFIVGDHTKYGPLEVDRRTKLRVPATPPFSLVNNWSLRAFNVAYWHKHSDRPRNQIGSYDSFFYPLDRFVNWNRVYGRKGFQQYQCVIPSGVAEVAIQELLARIAASGQGSFLAVLKRCGNSASPGLLSFPLPGVSLALDFPQKHALHPLFERLDDIVREAGGRLYPAKDAHMSGSDFRRAYPAWERIEALRDPILMSRFWKRVTT
ncbi:FAD-binding oxidoreductase [Pseudomonas bohemica]|uniref:FAD-binding oxidoreductase n=1 Tax=Pseudomonas bohemica TaxID=2044872 RepID=UPI000DA62BA0|nr:FAD-binding oxidoreductase [Pseudomonas bohemica]